MWCGVASQQEGPWFESRLGLSVLKFACGLPLTVQNMHIWLIVDYKLKIVSCNTSDWRVSVVSVLALYGLATCLSCDCSWNRLFCNAELDKVGIENEWMERVTVVSVQ